MDTGRKIKKIIKEHPDDQIGLIRWSRVIHRRALGLMKVVHKSLLSVEFTQATISPGG